MGLLYFGNNYFSNTIAGKMPFYPWKMVSSMSHKGLEGEDMTQCSAVFIFILINMAFRGTLSKLMGSEGPRMPIELATP
jgi:hypothetical protein